MDLESINLKIKSLPEKPGIYQYFDENQTIIYIGKAKNIKKRVSSYFIKNQVNRKTNILVEKIKDIHYLVVESELDALLLENNLIKKHQPKYNIQLKDDKTFPWICIKNEAFPRVFSTRQLIRDGSKYYGPYPNVKLMHVLLSLLKTLFPLRTCSLDLSENKILKNKYKVCLEYHIGNCKAPCVSLQKPSEYQEYISQIDFILKGNTNHVLNDLRQKMLAHSTKFEFELAHEMKEKIMLLEKYKSKSTVVSPTITEVDVLTLLNDEKTAFINYLVIKNGAIVHAYTSEIKKKLDENEDEIFAFSLIELRNKFNSQSTEVLVEKKFDVKIPNLTLSIPQRGDKKKLIDLSIRNTKYYRIEKIKQEKIKNPEIHTTRILNQMKIDLKLNEIPVHIECFDNSNIQGKNAVAACVVFKNGKASKKDYRHFNIKTVVGPDDFASMEEVVFRRYKRLIDENLPLPQLIVIDGGKGQLNSAINALNKLQLMGEISIIGIAKRLEEIFFPNDSIPIYLDKRSETLKLIQQLRNEAHRFGITHHRNKRSKSAITSELLEIKGIGNKIQEQLMTHFKSLSKIKLAELNDISAVIGKSKAQIIWDYYHTNS
jgi:excinuclease ABC subunit C